MVLDLTHVPLATIAVSLVMFSLGYTMYSYLQGKITGRQTLFICALVLLAMFGFAR